MDSSRRRPCFVEEEEDVEVGFSGNNHHPLSNKKSSSSSSSSSSSCYNRRSSLRNLSSMSGFSSPRSARFYDARFEDHHHEPHFLEACFLCQKPLGGNRDIFMYRGDTPFCSEECRQEQMDIDEAKEKNWNLSSSMKVLRKKKDQNNSPSKNRDYPYRTGAVAAA